MPGQRTEATSSRKRPRSSHGDFPRPASRPEGWRQKPAPTSTNRAALIGPGVEQASQVSQPLLYGGSAANAADATGPASEPTLLATSGTGSDSPQAAVAEVIAAEAELARAAAINQKAAHLAVMAEDGRLYVGRQPPAIGREAFADALSDWPDTFLFRPSQGALRRTPAIWPGRMAKRPGAAMARPAPGTTFASGKYALKAGV